MTLENERLHLRIAELEARLAEEQARTERAEGERANLRLACSRENEEICQTLGRALGYPKFCDDQKNFPGSTEADGVCVGPHTAASLAGDAAEWILMVETERDAARSCLAAFGVNPNAITPEAAARVYEQWQCDWDQAAKDGADAHNFRVERDKLQEALAHERTQLEQTQQVLRDRGVDPGQCAATLPQRVDQAIGDLQVELRGAKEAVERRAGWAKAVLEHSGSPTVLQPRTPVDNREKVDGPPVAIRYTNWRGEAAVRSIIPRSIRYAATEWHPEPQYLVEATDVDKGVERSFALKDFGGSGDSDAATTEVTHLKAELTGLEDRFNRVTAERTKYRLALQAIAESDFSERSLFAGFAWLKARETLGLATTGEGESQARGEVSLTEIDVVA